VDAAIDEDVDEDEDGEDEDGEIECGDEPSVRLDTTLMAVEAGRRLDTADGTSLSSFLTAVDSTLDVEEECDVRELEDNAEVLDPSANVIDIICPP
jgi:hypothetical protein